MPVNRLPVHAIICPKLPVFDVRLWSLIFSIITQYYSAYFCIVFFVKWESSHFEESQFSDILNSSFIKILQIFPENSHY